MNALLSVERAASLLGISPFTVRLYLRHQRLTPVRIGRRVLLEESELQRFIDEARTQVPGREAG
jgi:excisionase family DNA binding protein